jgi:diguanylate cyclase (GGDEF)-like protein
VTEPGSDGVTNPTIGDGQSGSARRASSRHPERDAYLLSAAMLASAVPLVLLTRDVTDPIRDGSWWVVVLVAVLFALSEITVFHLEFQREAISFSLSEVPTAFALVFLAPVPALLARLIGSLAMFLTVRRLSNSKLAFNLALFTWELAFVAFIFRVLIGGSEPTQLVTVVAASGAIALTTAVGSVFVSIVISRFEGQAIRRIVDEFTSAWWLYCLSASLAGMTLTLALVEPWLVLIAIPPLVGGWWVIRQFGDIGQRLRDLDAVHGFAGRVGQSLQLQEISESAVHEAASLLRSDSAALVRFDADGAAVATHTIGSLGMTLPDRVDDPAWRVIVDAPRATMIDPHRLRELTGGGTSDLTAVIAAPVRDEAGLVALLLIAERPGALYRFDEAHVARVQNLTDQLAASVRKGMLHERLEFEARHDALTELPARTLFEREVAATVEKPMDGQISFVLMFDLDRFKEVNDTLGHHAGDDLLIQFAARMTALLAPGDVLARLAGDEFAMLCHRKTRDEMVDFAVACVSEGGRPVTLDGLEIVVTVSLGVCEITEADVDALQPMRRADIAMYNAKWQRTGVEFYRDEIDRRTPARLSMLGDLRAAIEAKSLDVVYQPKLDLTSGRIVGVEALVRWEHLTRGVVAPAEFVRVAEDTGLIKSLTDLVLARGIETLRVVREHGFEIGLAVNLSTHDLFDSRLPDRVRAYLDSNGVEPGTLTLEITESSLFVDAPRTRATIDDLHDAGFKMAVDDFGTGYSSLSYLRRLPVNELKVDQSFVARMLTDPQDEVIVKSTIDLGHNLGLHVVAEGVESIAVMNRLSEFGCDAAQGYCISQPLSSDELIEWLIKAESARRSGTPTAWVGSI